MQRNTQALVSAYICRQHKFDRCCNDIVLIEGGQSLKYASRNFEKVFRHGGNQTFAVTNVFAADNTPKIRCASSR